MNAPVVPVLGIVGASGRLGCAVGEAAAGGDWRIGLRASREGWTMDERPDVLVDASRPGALGDVVAFCSRYRVPLVSATSGLDGAGVQRLHQLAGTVAVVRAANLTYGHHLQAELVVRLAALVCADRGPVEVTVHERHPTTKADSPSASARALVDAWNAESSAGPASIAVVRAGAPVSDHSIVVGFGGEELTITHSVRSLAVPARRALEAAAWASTAPPGLYTVADMYRANAQRLRSDEPRE